MFFSPGTFSTVAVTVWVPLGGVALSLTVQVAFWWATVLATVVVPLTLVPLIETLHPTLCSSLSPPLLKFSVNDRAELAGTVFVPPGVSVVPLTLTEVSEWPWRPGAGLPFDWVGTLMFNCWPMKLGWVQPT